jgi:hypothetical protein
MKKIKEYSMGDEFIIVKERRSGSRVVTLYRSNSFGVMEMENMNGMIRIKDLEIGSAFVDPSHLAMMLKEVGMLKVVSNILGE